jgi:hypothetical protein
MDKESGDAEAAEWLETDVGNPSVRYLTLADLLDRAIDDRSGLLRAVG